MAHPNVVFDQANRNASPKGRAPRMIMDAPPLPHSRTTLEQALDKGLKAALAKVTAGLSPIALTAAYTD